jgi:hypothetical protein
MKKAVFFLCFLHTLFLQAQEQFGSSFSNYTPTQSVFINPSSMLDSKTWLDIHVVGFGAYTMNNFAYLKNTSVIKLIKEGDSESYVQDKIRYKYNRSVNSIYNRSFANALSGVWTQGDHALGLFFNARSFTTVRGIPNEVSGIIDRAIAGDQFEQNKDYAYRDAHLSSLTFGEVQISYAYTFHKNQQHMFMGGVSIKKFIPIFGVAGQIYDVRFNQNSDSSFAYLYADMDAMYTNQVKTNFKAGMGLDLGFTYQRMEQNAKSYFPNSRRSGCKKVPYKFKLGASILDIGSVKYDEKVVQARGLRIDYGSTYNVDFDQFDADSIFSIVSGLDTILTDLDIKKSNKIHLPTALSLQFDYNLWKSKVYFNASLMQGFPISNQKFGSRRPNSLMAGIRYESRFFDVSIPFSLYEYRMPQLGFSFRLYFLTIGTDKLLSLLGTPSFYGTDIYAAIKIPIFYNPQCRTKMKNLNQSEAAKQKRFRKKVAKCPAYQ